MEGPRSTYRSPSQFANGNTRDRQGRLVTCEHQGRRVTRTEYDGSLTVLLDGFGGKRLNSPNDVVVKSDDSIWFTDPPFGIGSDYEGDRAEPELPSNVYRIDGRTGAPTVLDSEIKGPNGLAFSPDERIFYVVEGRSVPRRILAYDVIDGVRIGRRRTLIEAGDGGALDGFRCDEDGNLWCGWGMGTPELDGVVVFSPAGERIGRIELPERCANVCFGGRRRNRLFMAASQSLYALYVNTRGCI
jgi:gluconolactonase